MSLLLLALVGVNIVLGLFNVAVRGDSVFDWVTVPRLGADIDGLRDAAGDWHALGANLILAFAGLHAAAALAHHFVLHDDTLDRMRPRRRRIA